MNPRRAPTAGLEAIGTLTAGLAHEIRNPLNGALLHLRVLERALASGAVTPESRRALETVERELLRLSTLVDEFLDFARPQPLALVDTSVGALARSALLVVAPEAEAARVALELDGPEGDLPVHADAERLTTALVCLLRNAIESIAAKSAGGRVVLRWRAEAERVCIEIEDDGPGLAHPEEPVFDAFYTTKAKGTGLGLPIAHRVVTDHGGEMDVVPSPGATTFRVLLPSRVP